jgi:hypothetical protein
VPVLYIGRTVPKGYNAEPFIGNSHYRILPHRVVKIQGPLLQRPNCGLCFPVLVGSNGTKLPPLATRAESAVCKL